MTERGLGEGIASGWDDLETGIWIRPIYRNSGQADKSWNIYPWGAFDMCNRRSPRVCKYVPSVDSILCVCVYMCVCVLARYLSRWEEDPGVVGHVRRYGVTGNVTSPVVAETNNEEDRADVYTRSVRKRRLPGFADTTPARHQPTPKPAQSSIPTPSVRSPSGGSSPVVLVLSREVCPYISLLSSRLCVSPLLPFFHLPKKMPPSLISALFSSRPRALLSPLSFRNRHAFASSPAHTNVPLLLSKIATSFCVLPPSTRIAQPFTP